MKVGKKSENHQLPANCNSEQIRDLFLNVSRTDYPPRIGCQVFFREMRNLTFFGIVYFLKV